MPKFVEYAERFEEMRQAVLTIALRDGTRHINYPAVAAEVGVSVMTLRRLMPSAIHLPRLGMDLLDRRARALLMRSVPGELPPEDPRAAAWNLLLRDLPCTAERAEDARAWRLLTAGYPDAEWSIAARNGYQMILAMIVDRVVPEHLPPGIREFETMRLSAIVLGAIECVCSGTLSPAECVPLVRRHLEQQSSAWDEESSSGAA